MTNLITPNKYNSFDYSQVIDLITNHKTQKKAYKRKALYGADAGYCPRKNFLNANYSLDDREEPLYLTLSQKIGNTVEEYLLTNVLEKIRVVKSLRIPKSDEYAQESGVIKLILNTLNLNYSGIIDVITFDQNGNLSIIDVKTTATIDSSKYVKMDNDGNQLDKPAKAFTIEPTYLSQVTFYAAVTGINSAALLYVSRLLNEKFGENLSYKLEPVTLSEQSIFDSLNRAFFSQLSIEHGYLPIIPLEFHRGKTKYCKYCDFKDVCYNGAYDALHPSAKDSNLYEQSAQLAEQFMKIRQTNYQLIRDFFLSE